jgi:spastin
MIRLKQLLETAKTVINTAIDFEQQKRNSEALKAYADGLNILRKGADYAGTLKGSNEVEALKQKFIKYQKLVEERIAALKPPSRDSVLNKIDKELAKMILNEVLLTRPNVQWDDIQGLEEAKRSLKDSIVLPTIRPDLYTGLRSPHMGFLLYGPAGTGKTMLAKAVAHESSARFFSLSASTLLSKFYGESEKIIRTVFLLAQEVQPSILFFDEIDSILSKRSSDEHEASRRVKTEFLIQFDGLTSSSSGSDDRKLIVIGATNRPQELDEAARRRFPQRIYVGLPEPETRFLLLKNLLSKVDQRMSSRDMNKLVSLTDGYSCSDITALAKEAALYPLREYTPKQLEKVHKEELRPVSFADFKQALTRIRASVSKEEVERIQEWSRVYGTAG